MSYTKILFIGDVIGSIGVKTVKKHLPALMEEYAPDLLIVNGENTDEGRGISVEQVKEYLELGVDVITSGNHIWDNSNFRKNMRNHPNVLRPLNYPPNSGGKGYYLARCRNGASVHVVNLQGRAYLFPIDCPFKTMDNLLPLLKEESNLIFVDFHAESTAEKQALAWYLDGKVTAIVGTHTHVQTSDERILPQQTGYITDVGMTGPIDSVIGLEVSIGIHRFLTQTPLKMKVATHNPRLNGVFINADNDTGHCKSIERINLP